VKNKNLCFLFNFGNNLIMENDILIESPVKKSGQVRNNFRIPPAKITEMNNLFNSEMDKIVQEQYELADPIRAPQKNALLVGVCTRKLKRGNRVGDSCGKSVYKYGICSYHWGVWKKNNPFLKHP
jgi:hypothetical protein